MHQTRWERVKPPYDLHHALIPFFKLKSAPINFGINYIKRIVTAIGWTKISINPAIREILTISSQKGTSINKFAACSATMALALAIRFDRVFDVFRPKISEIKTAAFSQKLPNKALFNDSFLVPSREPCPELRTFFSIH